MVIQGVSYPSDFEAKKRMIEAGHRLDQKEYVIAGEGSLSVRVGPNAVWITADGVLKAELKQEHFIRVDMNGKPSPGSRQARLPEDLALHLEVYKQNPALRGVIHAYPAGAVAMAAAGREIPASDITPSVKALGKVPLSRQGGEEAVRQAALLCRTENGMMIGQDGCVMWGENLTEALYRFDALEYYVKVKRILEKGKQECTSRCVNCQKEVPQRAVQETSVVQTEERMPLPGMTGIIRPGMPFPGAHGKDEPAQPVKPITVNRPVSASAGDSQRRQMMDEVVRRSLERLQR